MRLDPFEFRAAFELRCTKSFREIKRLKIVVFTALTFRRHMYGRYSLATVQRRTEYPPKPNAASLPT